MTSLSGTCQHVRDTAHQTSAQLSLSKNARRDVTSHSTRSGAMPANANLGLSAQLVASLVGAYSTWALRWHTYVFLRLVSWSAWVMLMSQLPFGSRYSIKIGTCLGLYLGSTLFLRQRPSSPPTAIRRTLILASGFFDPPALLISWLNLSINLLCVFGCLDFVYRIHYLHSAHGLTFCRTGETTATSAKLLCRNPQSNFMTVSFCSPDGDCRDQDAASRDETDRTAVFDVTGLAPHTLYSYSASTGINGSFATTGQEEDTGKFTLLSSSCMKPNWPYNPYNHPLRIQGLEDLGSYLAASRKVPEMMLFLGDFICELSLLIEGLLNARFGSTHAAGAIHDRLLYQAVSPDIRIAFLDAGST
jgi:hypothetical protein